MKAIGVNMARAQQKAWKTSSSRQKRRQTRSCAWRVAHARVRGACTPELPRVPAALTAVRNVAAGRGSSVSGRNAATVVLNIVYQNVARGRKPRLWPGYEHAALRSVHFFVDVGWNVATILVFCACAAKRAA